MDHVLYKYLIYYYYYCYNNLALSNTSHFPVYQKHYSLIELQEIELPC